MDIDMDKEFFAPLNQMDRNQARIEARFEAALNRWPKLDRVERTKIIEEYVSDNDVVPRIAAALSRIKRGLSPGAHDANAYGLLLDIEAEAADQWATRQAESNDV